MTVIKEIYNIDINDYIVSSKSCKFNNGCILESQYGQALFDFSEYKQVDSCILYVKKVSGNGRLLITDGNRTSTQTHLVLSRTKHEIRINLTDSRKIDFSRNNSCTGDVHLFGFILESIIPIENKQQPWRDIVKRCGKHQKIILSGDKLLASEGGVFIQKENIASIETEPPNVCRKTKSGYVFIQSCEITDIKLTDEATKRALIAGELHPAFEKPAEIKVSTKLADHMIFDSNSYNLAGAKGRDISTGKNNKNIIIDRKGFVNIPIAGLEPSKQYAVVIEGNKTIGNGKFEICIMHNNVTVSSSVMIFGSMVQRRRVVLNTDTGSNFSLQIRRPESAVGSVNIHKLFVICEEESPLPSVPVKLQNNWSASIEGIFEVTENDMEKVHGVYNMPKNDDMKFAIIIPTYKNTEWVDRNLGSVLDQTSKNYRVLFIDDCSPDDTFDKAKKIAADRKETDRITFTRNTERKGALYNLYQGIHSCDDNEIVITLDGDDWLPTINVLDKLAKTYENSDVWMTYGQYRSYPDNAIGCSRQIPEHITTHNLFRQFRWCSSHLRTFYAWLFKKIKKEDMLDKSGNFYPMGWDLVFMFPLLEMSGKHAVFIPDVLYTYNVANPINDSKVNLKLQQATEAEVRAKPKYDKI